MLFPDSARNRLLGIGLASAAYFCFATIDVCAKYLVQSLPVLQVVWLRFVVHALLMALPAARGGDSLRWREVRSPWLQALRAMMLPAMTALNFWALQYLDLAVTGSVQFAVPILVALFAAWLLAERLDIGRWIAVLVGFTGVLVIVRPGTEGFHPAILISLANAVLYALFNLLTRRLVATDPPAVTNMLSALGAAVLIAPFALAVWQAPATMLQWVVIVVMGAAGGAGHLWLAQAHRYAPASTIAPFMYQQILYMVMYGWLVFGNLPGAAVLGGGAIVVASGLYLLWREQQRGVLR